MDSYGVAELRSRLRGILPGAPPPEDHLLRPTLHRGTPAPLSLAAVTGRLCAADANSTIVAMELDDGDGNVVLEPQQDTTEATASGGTGAFAPIDETNAIDQPPSTSSPPQVLTNGYGGSESARAKRKKARIQRSRANQAIKRKREREARSAAANAPVVDENEGP